MIEHEFGVLEAFVETVRPSVSCMAAVGTSEEPSRANPARCPTTPNELPAGSPTTTSPNANANALRSCLDVP